MIPRPQLSVRAYRRDPLGTMSALSREQGDVAVAYLGRQRLVYLSDPELIEQVFVKHSKQVDKKNRVSRWWLNQPSLAQYGPLVETHNRDDHRRARRALHPAFSKERARDDSGEMAEAMAALLTEQATRGACDLRTLGGGLFVAGFMASLFDDRLSLDTATRWMELRYQTADYVGEPMFVSRASRLNDRARQLLRLRALIRVVRAQGELDERAMAYLREPAPNTLPACFHAAGSGDDVARLLPLLLTAAEISSYMFPAWLALSDASLLEALRQESDLGGGLPLHRGVVMESLRLVSLLAVGRFCQQPFRVADVDLNPNDFIFVSPYLVNHDERWWPRPESFEPQRWLGDAEALRSRSAFLSFGAGGPRLCPGRHESIALMQVALQQISSSWQMEFLTEPKTVGWRKRALQNDVEPDRPVLVSLSPR